MSGAAVRRQFVSEFRRLRASSRAVAISIVAVYLLQILAAMALGYWLLQFELSAFTGIALAALILLIGTRLRGFNNIVHECCHFAFCDRREDNVLLGRFCAAMTLGCFSDYRDEHMTHHAHVGDYELDRDLQRIQGLRLEEPLTLRTVARHGLNIVTGRHLPYYLGVSLSLRDGWAFLAIRIGLIALAVLLLILDPVPALLLVWLPFVWVFMSINYLADCFDHAGLIGATDELDASRNISVPKALRLLFFPRSDCFHLVHHLFPQVPTRHLRACHERLLSHPDYHARVEGRRSEAPAGRDARSDGIALHP